MQGGETPWIFILIKIFHSYVIQGVATVLIIHEGWSSEGSLTIRKITSFHKQKHAHT